VDIGGPGVFLQGLATYGPDGSLLDGPSLPWDVVRKCFEYSERERVSLCAFLGDTCVTTRMTSVLEELHVRYYEPLAQVRGCRIRGALDAVITKQPHPTLAMSYQLSVGLLSYVRRRGQVSHVMCRSSRLKASWMGLM
jgi:hypothetical protein